MAGSMWLFDFMDMFYVAGCLQYVICVYALPFEGPIQFSSKQRTPSLLSYIAVLYIRMALRK